VRDRGGDGGSGGKKGIGTEGGEGRSKKTVSFFWFIFCGFARSDEI
jgi:hypothetical protein